MLFSRLLKNIQNEAQQYVRQQDILRSSQQTTITALKEQNRTKRPVKQCLFPPIRRNEEKVQSNRKIYRNIVVSSS